MTYQEFSREFDKLYDNLATKGAPGVDDYDKSLLLTEAQEDIVKAVYNGSNVIDILGNRFEISEDSRRSLDALIVDAVITQSDLEDPITEALPEGDLPNSYFISYTHEKLQSKPIWWILMERAHAITDCSLETGEDVYVIPVGHDEYNVYINNPYRRPNRNKIWRMDHSNGITLIFNPPLVKISETSGRKVFTYYVRYITQPEPIIVNYLKISGANANTDLAAYYSSNLSVNGISTPQTCKLHEKMHRPIVKLAVQKAILRYKENSLGNVTQLTKTI